MVAWSIDEVKFPCHFKNDHICKNGFNCFGCELNPPDDEKKNGKAAPVLIGWEPDYFGGGMGFPMCPSCGEMPYSTERCLFCGQRFIQDDEKLKAFNEPAPEETMTCLICGGKVIGHRTKCNGHFHGVCEKCGGRVME